MKTTQVELRVSIDEDNAPELVQELREVVEAWGLAEEPETLDEGYALSAYTEAEIADTEDMTDEIADLPPEPDEKTRAALLMFFFS